MKLKLNKENRLFMWGSIYGLFLCILLLYLIHPVNIFSKIAVTPQFNMYSILEQNSPYIKFIVNRCSLYDDAYKPECVVKTIDFQYNYNRTGRTLHTADYFFQNGNKGVCRDVAYIYSLVFKGLGWEYDYIFYPNHVTLTVWNKDGSIICYLSNAELRCF